jgi:hypothetical protein
LVNKKEQSDDTKRVVNLIMAENTTVGTRGEKDKGCFNNKTQKT